MNTKNFFCREVMLGSEELPIIFSTAYQRALIEDQVRGIRQVR